jgi:tetratricopeptide (TPR) repeat protein
VVAGPSVVCPRAAESGDARNEHVRARAIRARGIVTGESTPAIAAMIRSECGPAHGTTWIRAYRLALGIALADVVAQVRAWYEAEGRKVPRFSETLLSAYESGQKRPGPEYLHYLCAVYCADPQDLGYQGRCFCGQSHAAAAHAAAADAAAAGGAAARRPAAARPVAVAVRPAMAPERAAAARAPVVPAAKPLAAVPPPTAPDASRQDGDGTGAGDVLRGMLLMLLKDVTTAADSRFFGAADQLRRRLDDALLGRTVSVTMLDQWEETTAGYGARYMTEPPLRLLCDVLLDLGDIRRMCAERQPIECAERLCRLAGQLAGLTGLAMIDLGDQRLARSFFRTARTAADETGDRRLRAWVTAREALVPLYYGDPREAAALARTGTDLAGRNPCVARVIAPVIEARALARLAGRGRREALDRVRGAIDRARDALSELSPADSADTAFGYTERQLFFHEGDALVTLGDYQGATRAFAHALRLYSPAEFLDRALVMFGEARCLAEADEPAQALRLGRDTFVSLPRQHRTEIVLHAARGLGESVAARHERLPALRDYSDALQAGLSWRRPAQPEAGMAGREGEGFRRQPHRAAHCPRAVSDIRFPPQQDRAAGQ